jgi:hypothetical protein
MNTSLFVGRPCQQDVFNVQVVIFHFRSFFFAIAQSILAAWQLA